MSGRIQNYRVINPELDRNCGHKHHSRDSAIKCADCLGWTTDIILQRFDSRKESEGKLSLHHGRRRFEIDECRLIDTNLQLPFTLYETRPII